MFARTLPLQTAAPRHLHHRLVALACALAAGAAWSQTTTPDAAPAAAAAAPAAASTPAEGSGITQVTVTARKRSEKLLEVPISLQTFSEKELRASGTSDITDLGSQSGFKFTSAQGSGAQGRSFGVVTFRGLQGELNFPWENSGGVFIDGIFVSGGVSSIGMNDVSRVEVLKGPQNAFFGRSTFGGAVNFITKLPATTFSGVVNATINNHGTTDVDATLEGPLVDDLLRGRISFGSRNKAASYTATDGGELGAEGTKFVSGTLYFTPNDNLWLRLRGHVQRDEDSTPASAYLSANGSTSCTGRSYTGQGKDGATVGYTPSVPYFCGSIPSIGDVGAGVFNANTSIPSAAYAAFVHNSLNDPVFAKAPTLSHTGMLRDTKRASGQLGYTLPNGMDLAVNLGYNESTSTSIYDVDRTGTSALFAAEALATRDLTLDARLSTNAKQRLRGVLGMSYFKSSYQQSQINYLPLYATAAPAYVGPSLSTYRSLDSSVPAVYGSVEYDFTPKITGSFEVRRQSDKIESTSRAGVTVSNEVSNWLPRLTLRYKPSENISTYVNLAQGVQPLSVNTDFAAASAAGKAYIQSLYPGTGDFTPQPKLTSLEAGIKQRVNDQLGYALAIYQQKWTDRLSGTSVFNPTSCGTTIYTTECPFSVTGSGMSIGNDAVIRGIELSVEAQINKAWSAGAYLDLKRATWDRFDSAGQSVYARGVNALTGTAVSFNGNELGRTPKVMLSANTTYRFGLPNGWTSYVRGDLTYVGKQWDTDFNLAQMDAYARVDARWGIEKGGMTLELFVKNLANDRSWVTVYRSPNLSVAGFTQQGLFVTAQEERSVGARMRYAF